MSGRFAGGRDVIIANHAEYNRSWMHGFTSRERWPWDTGAQALADQSLFWCGAAKKTVFMAKKPDGQLIRDVSEALLGCEIEVVETGGEPFISRAIASDEALLGTLSARLGSDGGGRLHAWGLTRGLIVLMRRLRELGCVFSTPGLPPPEFYPEALELDSKTGARFFLTRSGIPMPGGTIVTSIGEAANAARYFLNHRSGAVIKADNGSGGFAVRAFTMEQIASRPDYVRRDLELRARLDGAWRAPLFVVERLAEAVDGVGPLAPTGDWVIDEGGAAICQGVGLMKIRHRSLYGGVEAGVGVMDAKLASGCEEIGAKVAALLAERGYRGWFDLDFVADAEKNVYVTELNMRRTCPAHAFELARARLGNDWAGRACVMSIERLYVGGGEPVDYQALSTALADWNRNAESAGAFAVASGVTSCLDRPRPEAGVVLLAPKAAGMAAASESLTQSLKWLGGNPGGG